MGRIGNVKPANPRLSLADFAQGFGIALFKRDHDSPAVNHLASAIKRSRSRLRSGRNLFGKQQGDIAEGIDANGIFGWIDNYCSAHPLENLADAAAQLVFALAARFQPPLIAVLAAAKE